MSFAAEVKAELAGLTSARACCQLHELRGAFHSVNGAIDPAGRLARFPLLRNLLARRVVRLTGALGAADSRFQHHRTPHQTLYNVEAQLPTALVGSLVELPGVPERACDRKALLRGFFLGCGSVNAPSARYHLEFVPPSVAWAEAVQATLAELSVRSGVSTRGAQPLVYVKDGNGIVRTLSLLGASRSVMEFESLRIVREVRGLVNRKLNFETANLGKTIGSAVRQLAAIEQLEKRGRLEGLPPALRDVARLRRGNPEAALAELGARLRVSKSAVNHRLRRLELEAAGASRSKLPD